MMLLLLLADLAAWCIVFGVTAEFHPTDTLANVLSANVAVITLHVVVLIGTLATR